MIMLPANRPLPERPIPLRPEPGEDEVRLLDLWRALVRRRRLVLGITGTVVALAALATSQIDPVYEGRASIRVEEPNATLNASLIALAPAGMAGASGIMTDIEMLRSRSLAEAVIDSLGLQLRVRAPAVARASLFRAVRVQPDAPPRALRLERAPDGAFAVSDAGTGERLGTLAAAGTTEVAGARWTPAPGLARHAAVEVEIGSRPETLEELAGALRVERRRRDANVVDVSYRSTDAELARAVPNFLVARFMEGRQGQRQVEARSTAAFLRGQIATLGAQLREAENRLRGYREAAQVVSIADQAGSAVQGAAQLRAQRDLLAAEQASLSAVLGRIQSAPRAPDAPSAHRELVAFPALLRSPAASGVLAALSEAEVQRTQLRARRSEQDPDVQLLTARIRQLESEIEGMAVTYGNSLGAQVAALDGTIRQSARQMATIPARELEFARLAREARTLEEGYLHMQQRLREAELVSAVEDPSVRVIDAAVLPFEPVVPKPGTYLALALVGGLLLSGAATAIRERTDRSIHSRRDLVLATGLPVLALVPRAERRRLGTGRALIARRPGAAQELRPILAGNPEVPRLFPSIRERTPFAESYNRLQMNLAFTRPHASVRAVTITSALPGEGKSTSAINLALTLARHGTRVLLVDADLRRGLLAEQLGVPDRPGLAEVVQGLADLADAVHAVDGDGGSTLDLLPAGARPADPARLLGSQEMHALLEGLRGKYEAIVLDAPPLNLVTDAALLGTQSDGVVLVARAGNTTEDAIGYALTDLQAVGAPVLGVILNEASETAESGYGRGYAYYQGADRS